MMSGNGSNVSQAARSWVLVVDDEPGVRDFLSEALNAFGVASKSAAGAEEAWQMVEAADSEPLLVITDVMMPGTNGLVLARRLLKRLPHRKVVIMSGHLTDAAWWPEDLRACVFLAKPFSLAAIEKLVRGLEAEYDSTT